MFRRLTVLAACAHPDDLEFHCAGTLIRDVKAGCKVYMAEAYTGGVGAKIRTDPEIEANILEQSTQLSTKSRPNSSWSLPVRAGRPRKVIAGTSW